MKTDKATKDYSPTKYLALYNISTYELSDKKINLSRFFSHIEK
jgi:hypothetical protein